MSLLNIWGRMLQAKQNKTKTENVKTLKLHIPCIFFVCIKAEVTRKKYTMKGSLVRSIF